MLGAIARQRYPEGRIRLAISVQLRTKSPPFSNYIYFVYLNVFIITVPGFTGVSMYQSRWGFRGRPFALWKGQLNLENRLN